MIYLTPGMLVSFPADRLAHSAPYTVRLLTPEESEMIRLKCLAIVDLTNLADSDDIEGVLANVRAAADIIKNLLPDEA